MIEGFLDELGRGRFAVYILDYGMCAVSLSISHVFLLRLLDAVAQHESYKYKNVYRLRRYSTSLCKSPISNDHQEGGLLDMTRDVGPRRHSHRPRRRSTCSSGRKRGGTRTACQAVLIGVAPEASAPGVVLLACEGSAEMRLSLLYVNRVNPKLFPHGKSASARAAC